MSLEFTKVAAAVLTGGIVVMLSGFVADELIQPGHLEENAYPVAAVEGGGGGGEEPSAPAPESVLPLLAEADVAHGEALTKNCTSCHSFEQGGANKIGPNLYGIVNEKIAAVAGYSFSSALQKLGEEGKSWDYESLDHWLASPRNFAPGTKMTYAGLKKVQDRADLIAYLRTLADSPAPLPTQEETAAAAEQGGGEEKPAEGGEQPAQGEEQPAQDGAEQQAEGSEQQPAEGEQQPAEGGTEQQAEGTEQQPAQGEQQPAETGLPQQIAAADPAKGQQVSRVCAACHSFDKGGANKVGPNLWGVVGAKAAHLEGYNYSKAMQDAAASGLTWTYENLDQYLASPRKMVPGTKMTFAGVSKPEDRVALIAWLREQGDNPPPLE